ncbi:YihY/virulence factor BrkB family protein [Candidatus Saccharibacteria bacterium]|nr:YihY/virulence factor BrkB family protein [Candidatus Saccharibacteria bacterium]
MSFQSLLESLDTYQQKHQFPGLTYGVIRKYGDDNGGYLAALITYYGFLALFPLLLVLASLIKIALSYHVPFAINVSHAVGNIFPLFGDDLQSNIHGISKTGVGLIVGIIISLWGARGVADALRYALNEIWGVPRSARGTFADGVGRSLRIIFVGGGGFILASVVSTYVQTFGGNVAVTVLANLMSAAIIYLTLLGVFVLAKPEGVKRSQMRHGAIATAMSFQLLQLVGAYIITHQIHNLSLVYGTFAVVLGLIFYLSIQAQILVYALEYNVVRVRRLWPRSLTQDPITDEDKLAFAAQAKKEGVVKDEVIRVGFKD